MPDPDVLKILFVLNPVSGGKSKKNWEAGIRDYFSKTPHKCEFYSTNGVSDKDSLKYWIDSWVPDRVVAVGGDGTLKLTAEVLLGANIPLAVFPAGSANGMAREIAMPADINACISVLLAGKTRSIDVIRINQEHISLHLSDIGLNAQLVKYFEEDDVRGLLGYAKEVFKVLWRRQLMQVDIRKDETRLRREAFMIVLANARMYGTGATINPQGDISDGLFEVVVLRKLSFREFLKMLFFHVPFNPEKIEILQADSITIQVRKKAYFQVDGEYLGKTKRLTASILPGALQMLVPADDRKGVKIQPQAKTLSNK